jgi:predicted ATP-binding protein involved in virulence
MRVTEISVKGLFGTFNHYIPLMHADRVTLIHGPNGLGKTVMLKMISALIDGHTGIFERVPFEEFIVRLDDGKTITVRHREGAAHDDGKRRVAVQRPGIGAGSGAAARPARRSAITPAR